MQTAQRCVGLSLLVLAIIPFCAATAIGADDPTPSRPNIVFILADDMSYDSVAALNDRCGIATPNIDRLVSQGMLFSDAHSGSAVCSPTRYGVLTGRYSWRTKMKRGIVGIYRDPLITADRMTVASMLKDEGYATACIGKWHLGWNWPDKDGNPTYREKEVDFTRPTTGGPTYVGFDHYYGDDVPNWPPYVWIDDDQAVGIPSVPKTPGMFGSNGLMLPGWTLEPVLPEITRRSAEYITERAETPDQPFFLYFPMTSPHTPVAPNEQFKGKSGVSEYADWVIETDWCVGQLLDALDKTGQADNTLVFFTADNGTSRIADFPFLEEHGVNLTNHYRGSKADIWEGGHRVPFIVRWPGHVEPGTTCDETICLTDFMATAAEVVGVELPDSAGEDSMSLLTLMSGREIDGPLHADGIVNHSVSGHFAVRNGPWKLIFAHGSGGWTAPNEAAAKKAGLPAIQLYNLDVDPKEQMNVYQQHPELVTEMTEQLKGLVKAGRSTPGTEQQNDTGAWWAGLPWGEGE